MSRNTVRRYVRIYQECGVSPEHLLTMKEEHLRDMLFGSKERIHTPTHKEVALQELLPEFIGACEDALRFMVEFRWLSFLII